MNTQNEIVIYQMPNGEMQLDVTVSGETIWLTQRQIAELFGTKVPAISKHLKNYYCPIKILQNHKIRADFICEVSPFSLDFSRQTIKSNHGQKYTF